MNACTRSAGHPSRQHHHERGERKWFERDHLSDQEQVPGHWDASVSDAPDRLWRHGGPTGCSFVVCVPQKGCCIDAFPGAGLPVSVGDFRRSNDLLGARDVIRDR